MPQLVFDGVSHRYNTPEGETYALAGFSCSFGQGDFTAIVGPSGCGKSTILSLAAGLLRPAEGRVLLDGEPVRGVSPRMGYMLQSDHLFGWLTIEQNAQVGLRVRRMLTGQKRAEVRDLLRLCGLAGFEHSFPSQLSGGMRQRAALVRTLAPDPDILLLDEPFSALDYQTRLTVAQEVHSAIKSRGKTAILVTHDIVEAVSLADRVIVLSARPGRIKADHRIELAGTPLERRAGSGINAYFEQIWKELGL